ncbi:MAG: hypothetical protein OXF72_05930 [Gammaproteobacteria bacterium]|nr:hypothetical protein [Gammaproteobacteria bacterium]MCY4198985.1 hypothetical protein [Gammaproteobacteria bacterium]MCY4276765.1 hypothetical protein [Gammaproteobacteria bacterium]
MSLHTRAALMKHFGIRELDKPPCPVRFAGPGELSQIEREEQAQEQAKNDRLVEQHGGYQALYGDATKRLPPVKDEWMSR